MKLIREVKVLGVMTSGSDRLAQRNDVASKRIATPPTYFGAGSEGDTLVGVVSLEDLIHAWKRRIWTPVHDL
jgi:hypothetical protein